DSGMNKKKTAQKKLINELRNQLLIQAETLGIRDKYTPVVFEEMKLDAVRKILTEFYMERANLEYELSMFGSNKKELLIKSERLNSYIRKAEGIREQHLKKFSELLEKGVGDREKTQKAVNRINPVRIRIAA
ncbi:MAG: hypothetical protein QME05_06370, partial [Candidatus Margulisbacteria bacterium]|nr:hypothetical protein [Candidatus Margulisiibacteriota bacterium]